VTSTAGRFLAIAAGSEKLPVLVVEDDPDNQAYMKMILGKSYEVLFAASGQEVRQHPRAYEGMIPMMVMDLLLTGPKLTRFLRSHEE